VLATEYVGAQSVGQILLVCRFLAGEVRATTRLRQAMANLDIVIHAAAMKHVDVVEVTPTEAGTTAVLGTQHVIETVLHAGLERVLHTSADTLVEPTTTTGVHSTAVVPVLLYYVGACGMFR